MKRLDEVIYSNEKYFSEPKQSFFFVDSLLGKHGKKPSFSLLDIGCARGEFLYFLRKKHAENPQKFTGIDISEALIAEARKHLDHLNIELWATPLESFSSQENFDCITLCGVMGYVADMNSLFKKLGSLLAPDGIVVTFGFANPYDIDVFNTYRFKEFEDTANFHSLTSIKQAASNAGLSFLEGPRFELPFSIPRDDKNPRRSWTLKTEEGVKFVNGLGQIFDMYGLVFRLTGQNA